MADETKQTKTASVLFGIPQLGLTHVDRQVPLDEPPPLPANAAELRNISRRVLCLSKNFGVIFVPPFECELRPSCLSLFCSLL